MMVSPQSSRFTFNLFCSAKVANVIIFSFLNAKGTRGCPGCKADVGGLTFRHADLTVTRATLARLPPRVSAVDFFIQEQGGLGAVRRFLYIGSCRFLRFLFSQEDVTSVTIRT